MKKLNNTTYKYAAGVASYNQYKVQETNEGFLLNTVYHYNKETFEPTTYQSYNNTSNIDTLCEVLALNTHFAKSVGRVLPSIKNNLIVDLYNPNVYYTYSPYSIEKNIETEGVLVSNVKRYFNDNTYLQYLGQSELYLYFAVAFKNYNVTAIYSCLKETLVTSQISSFYAYSSNLLYYPMVIKETDDNIYFLYHTTNTTGTSPSYLYVHIGVIDKVNNKSTTVSNATGALNSFSVSANYMINLYSEATVKINDVKYGILVRYGLKNSYTANAYIALVTVDITDETAPVYSYNLLPITDFTVPTAETVWSVEHDLFLTTIDNKEYLHYIRYRNNLYFFLSTFEVNRDENNVPVSLKQIYFVDTTETFSCQPTQKLTTQDNKVMVLLGGNNMSVLKINEETGIFELQKTKYLENSYRSAGIDKLNRIWVMDNNYNIEIFTLTDFSTYSLEFEKEQYSYLGEEISTYVKVRCLDMIGTYINGSVNLVISGNAVFDANNTKALTVEIHSTDTEDLQIPITITGAGRIIIYPTLVTD